MFTGIVTARGRIAHIERRNGLTRWTVESPYDAASVALGASILHAGCCLTVVEAQALAGDSKHADARVLQLGLTTRHGATQTQREDGSTCFGF